MLAGVAGIMLAGLFNISPSMGNDPLLRAFIVVVFGGLGSLPGTIIGAYAVGLIEAVSSFYIGIDLHAGGAFRRADRDPHCKAHGFAGTRRMNRPGASARSVTGVVLVLAIAAVAPLLLTGSVAQNLAILGPALCRGSVELGPDPRLCGHLQLCPCGVFRSCELRLGDFDRPIRRSNLVGFSAGFGHSRGGQRPHGRPGPSPAGHLRRPRDVCAHAAFCSVGREPEGPHGRPDGFGLAFPTCRSGRSCLATTRAPISI